MIKMSITVIIMHYCTEKLKIKHFKFCTFINVFHIKIWGPPGAHGKRRQSNTSLARKSERNCALTNVVTKNYTDGIWGRSSCWWTQNGIICG